MSARNVIAVRNGKPVRSFLTAIEAAEVLGVSEKAFRQCVRAGLITPYCFMGKTRFSVADLNEYLESVRGLAAAPRGVAGQGLKTYRVGGSDV